MAELAKAEELPGESGGEHQALAFIDHHRQRYADRVPLAWDGEFLIGEYGDDGGVGAFGEFKIQLHHLGDQGGLLHPQLCVFGDGTAALAALLDLAHGDLRRVLRTVVSREEFSSRLLGFGLRDASDNPLEGSR